MAILSSTLPVAICIFASGQVYGLPMDALRGNEGGSLVQLDLGTSAPTVEPVDCSEDWYVDKCRNVPDADTTFCERYFTDWGIGPLRRYYRCVEVKTTIGNKALTTCASSRGVGDTRYQCEANTYNVERVKPEAQAYDKCPTRDDEDLCHRCYNSLEFNYLRSEFAPQTQWLASLFSTLNNFRDIGVGEDAETVVPKAFMDSFLQPPPKPQATQSLAERRLEVYKQLTGFGEPYPFNRVSQTVKGSLIAYLLRGHEKTFDPRVQKQICNIQLECCAEDYVYSHGMRDDETEAPTMKPSRPRTTVASVKQLLDE